LFAQHSVLFSKVVDELQLLPVHPAGQREQQKPEGSRNFVMGNVNIIKALHGGPVGDPSPIYADRLSGHCAVDFS
jgi:hypothetical protein